MNGYEKIINKFLSEKVINTRYKGHYAERLFIADNKLYSYGFHYLLSRFYKTNKDKFLIVNRLSSSQTTERQKRILLNSYYGKILFLNGCATDKINLQRTLNANNDEIKELKQKVKRQRKEQTKQDTLNTIENLKEQNKYIKAVVRFQEQKEILEKGL